MADQDQKQTRGKGRGSNFFALDPDVLARLWTIETTNRMNLILTFLVLLAGTGSDHRLTKWSAKACEEYLGLGKPRAKLAIEELIASGLVRRTEASTMLLPQYQLPALPLEKEPIFLPVQIVTGFRSETPVLRRVRETGDPLLLRMLIDFYSLVALDATHGIPLKNLSGGKKEGDQPTARKAAEVGAHAVWAFEAGSWMNVAGDWTRPHKIQSKDSKVAWQPLWHRLALLKQIGAIYDEPWIFESDNDDAEPIMPLDMSGFYGVADPSDAALLTRRALSVCRALVGNERTYVFDQGEFFLPLPLHRQTPVLRQVTRLRVEADTPGRRLAWKRRQALIEHTNDALEQLELDASSGQFGRPMRSNMGAKLPHV